MNRAEPRRRPGGRRRVAGYVTAMVVEAALAPVVVLVGEPLRNRYLHRRGGTWRSPGPYRRLDALALNPVALALTAPARWVGSRAWRRVKLTELPPGHGDGPPFAGVREPRRPKPTPPADARELSEPH